MKKMLLMAYVMLYYSMLVFPTTLLAPSVPYQEKYVYVEEIQPINIGTIYDSLAEAIRTYESNKNDSAYNAKEGATGSFQIRQCRVDHYNTLTGKNYTLKDMYNYKIAKEVFLYFAQGKTFEQAAKKWNGSGPKTEKYWANIKAILERNNS